MTEMICELNKLSVTFRRNILENLTIGSKRLGKAGTRIHDYLWNTSEAKPIVEKVTTGVEAKPIVKEVTAGVEAKPIVKEVTAGVEAKPIVKKVTAGVKKITLVLL